MKPIDIRDMSLFWIWVFCVLQPRTWGLRVLRNLLLLLIIVILLGGIWAITRNLRIFRIRRELRIIIMGVIFLDWFHNGLGLIRYVRIIATDSLC
jgi:hypothetical protein